MELDFDPSSSDGDGDGRRDDRELREDTDPYVFDLDGGDKAQALVGGALFGDAGRSWVARNVARLTEAHIGSPWYLGGWLAGGYLAVGDVRDALYGLWQGNWGDALLSAAGLVPFAGDAVKTVKVVVDYAKMAPGSVAGALRFLRKNLPSRMTASSAGMSAASVSTAAAGGGDMITDAIRALGRAAQLKQDARVAGRAAPDRLALDRKISKSPTQNQRAWDDIEELQKDLDVDDIRLNQWQVDADGKVVGMNRPDLQYTKNGKRYYVEYDTSVSKRGEGHRDRILTNDVNADPDDVSLLTVD